MYERPEKPIDGMAATSRFRPPDWRFYTISNKVRERADSVAYHDRVVPMRSYLSLEGWKNGAPVRVKKSRMARAILLRENTLLFELMCKGSPLCW